MKFIIDMTELALFAAATEKVQVSVTPTDSEMGMWCQNCRDACDSWCTQQCFTAPTKNPPTHP